MAKFLAAAALTVVVLTGSSAYAAAPTTYVAPAAVPLKLESPARARGARLYIVCNEHQARSFLSFMELSSDAPHVQKLRALNAGNSPRDGRLCETRMLDNVQIGGTVHRQTINGREWHVISASRFDPTNRKTYYFKVVGGVDK